MSLTNGDKLFTVNPTQLKHVANFYKFEVNSDGIKWLRSDDTQYTQINSDGISLPNGDNNHVLTSNASTIDITQYALKSELLLFLQSLASLPMIASLLPSLYMTKRLQHLKLVLRHLKLNIQKLLNKARS